MKLIMENWNKFVAESDRLTRAIDDSEARDEASQDFQIRHDAMTMLRDFLNELSPDGNYDWIMDDGGDDKAEETIQGVDSVEQAIPLLAKWLEGASYGSVSGEQFLQFVKGKQ
jgi:hypothetical protein